MAATPPRMMETTHPAQVSSAWAPIPGPADRVSFFDEQRRRRRQTWRFTALCGVAAAIVGVPLAMFVTPFVFLVTVGVLRLAERSVPVPEPVWSELRDLARFVPGVLSLLAEAGEAVRMPFGHPLLALAALVVPGMLAMVLIWLGYRALFRQAGVGGALLALGARAPRADDLEERQLVNLVEEMAIASGLPPPRVRLLDSSIPNAAVVGSSIHDATLIVTRGLLDRLDRDETQGLIAHLVGSVGNGDLRIALSITTVFQAVELVFTGFDALLNLSPSAWRILMGILRWSAADRADPRAAAAVARMLDHQLGVMREDGVAGLMQQALGDQPRTRLGRIFNRFPFLVFLILPLILLYIPFVLLRFQVFFLRLLLIGPLLMLVWRTRRLLADATAVQLTRNPDGLARALARLVEEGAVVPGGQWFSHLFVVGPEAVRARKDAAVQRRLAELWAEGKGAPLRGRLSAGLKGYRAWKQHTEEVEASEKGTWAAELGGVASHPPLAKRLKRLRALGARLQAEEQAPRPRFGPVALLLNVVLTVVLLPLVALTLYLLLCVVAAIFLLAVFSAVLLVGIIMALLYGLLF